jgi:hypothetical protein
MGRSCSVAWKALVSLIVRAVGLADGCFLLLLLLLDVVDLLVDLPPVFEVLLDDEGDFDLAAGFFVAVDDVAGCVDWAMMPPGVVNASRELTTKIDKALL